MTCVDCGTDTPTTLDALPICDSCARVALAVAGSIETRIAQLGGAA